ncbi:hypothetical protein K443DRAFT_15778 [Laccaria amethystina LaAM-08-1]|uniref:Uncharacterized protein n=1 Tax=Laccaria amethystina LaAM-08-1 TaxID=1095629 RepID=A0A0C9WZI8_9AGAR|nr:hypothetical protein K443DRAFT_15778 [Laccaria amethystina LaAM-08-1]
MSDIVLKVFVSGFEPSPGVFYPPPNFNLPLNSNPLPNFPGGYMPNWPNVPPAPTNYPSGPPGNGPSGPPRDEPPQ